MSTPATILIGVTGASGTPFTRDFLLRCPGEKHVIASDWGKRVFRDETGETLETCAGHAGAAIIENSKLNSRFCSGGASVQVMIIIPCSSNTLGKIAAGIADSTLTRAAQVTLKEGRKLILCLREAPLSTIDLENALKVAHAGAVIMPLSPMWYFRPENIADLISAYTDRLIAQCGGSVGRIWPEGRS